MRECSRPLPPAAGFGVVTEGRIGGAATLLKPGGRDEQHRSSARHFVGAVAIVALAVSGDGPNGSAATYCGDRHNHSHRRVGCARTADGHPDIHGVWANNTVTPLQRPKQWEDKDAAHRRGGRDLQKFAAQIVENDGDAQFGDGFILAVLNRIANPKFVRSGDRQLQPVLAGRARLARSAHVADRRSAEWKAAAAHTGGAETTRGGNRASPGARVRRSGSVPAGRALRELRHSADPGRLQQLRADRAVARLRHDRQRDGARRAHHPARRPAASRPAHPRLERRFARTLGGRHARDRHDELLAEERFHGLAREPAPHRTPHARRSRTSSTTNSPSTIPRCGRRRGPR